MICSNQGSELETSMDICSATLIRSVQQILPRTIISVFTLKTHPYRTPKIIQKMQNHKMSYKPVQKFGCGPDRAQARSYRVLIWKSSQGQTHGETKDIRT